MYVQQRDCLFSVFSQNFHLYVCSFSRWKYSVIQDGKFLFFERNMSNNAIQKESIYVIIICTRAYLYGTVVCFAIYHTRFHRIAFLRVLTSVLKVRGRILCQLNHLTTIKRHVYRPKHQLQIFIICQEMKILHIFKSVRIQTFMFFW